MSKEKSVDGFQAVKINQKRSISDFGEVLFVGSVFSDAPYGSHVVMRELLRRFSPESFCIFSNCCSHGQREYEFESRTLRTSAVSGVYEKFPYGGMVKGVLSFSKAIRWVSGRQIAAVVAVYPSLDLLPLALFLANRLNVPFFSLYA